MNKFIIFMSFLTASFCENHNKVLLADDYKCSLPDVTSVDNDLDIHRFRSDFAKVSEVKFPGLIGPLNERLICKIKCVDGNWVGPLCSPTQNGRFKPILRECPFSNPNPILTVSYKNKTILNDTSFSHGSELVARCSDFGLYKISGDNILTCNNGNWSNKMPTCVPTSQLTNYTGGAPPTIQFTTAAGSAIVDPTGALLVYPGSTVWLDCLWPRGAGQPEWRWSTTGQHAVGWSTREGESELHYRVSLARAAARHSGRYTCVAPPGGTNSAVVKVVSVVCPARQASSPHLRQFSHGSRLGSAIHYSCQQGYRLEGASVVICMGDGRWSGEAPRCEQVRCPGLRAAGAARVDYSAAVGGRAAWACAWGYRLVGAPELECEADGSWSDAAPDCLPIYCPDPPNVPDKARLSAAASSRAGKHPVGDLLVYLCDPGYQIVGENSIVCTESGIWSHPLPICQLPSETRKHDTIFVDNVTFVNSDE